MELLEAPTFAGTLQLESQFDPLPPGTPNESVCRPVPADETCALCHVSVPLLSSLLRVHATFVDELLSLTFMVGLLAAKPSRLQT